MNIHQKITIRSHYKNLPSRKIATIAGFHSSTVQKYMRIAKLKVSKAQQKLFRVESMKGKTIFTAEQDQVLIKEYLNIAEKPLARIIGVSSTCLRTRKKQLGLVTPKIIIERRKKESRFNKGDVAHNKGKKLSDFLSKEQIRKMKRTQFKKGRKPNNTLSGVGFERIRVDSKTKRQYKYVKLADSNWQLLARVNYEKYCAPIPDGHIVIYKDGNTLNCNPSNLRTISKKENARRNLESYHNHPPELKTAIKLKNKIKKIIKDNGN